MRDLPEADEVALVPVALELDAAGTLRRVFDNSARLGAGFRLHYGQAQSLETLPALLGALGVGCLGGGAWRAEGAAGGLLLERPPCRAASTARECDYWREAIDGLVVGLGIDVRHTRHRSLGHGDATCLDVLYQDPESPLRFGVLPDGLQERLAPVQRLVKSFQGGAELQLLGLSEGVLLYRLSATDGCRDATALRTLVEEALAQKLPDLAFQEMSPRPVLGPDTAATPIHEETAR